MRNRFGPKTRRIGQKSVSGERKLTGESRPAITFAPGELEKLFEFARARNTAPEVKEISFSYKTSRKPDEISQTHLRDKLDAAKFAIKEIRALASDARETFNKRRLMERSEVAADMTRNSLETETAGEDGPADDTPAGGRAEAPRRTRRLRHLFRRR